MIIIDIIFFFNYLIYVCIDNNIWKFCVMFVSMMIGVYYYCIKCFFGRKFCCCVFDFKFLFFCFYKIFIFGYVFYFGFKLYVFFQIKFVCVYLEVCVDVFLVYVNWKFWGWWEVIEGCYFFVGFDDGGFGY